jgi:hypothetical protein
MKSLEEGFIKTKENLIESDEIVRKLKTSLESFSEINMEDRGRVPRRGYFIFDNLEQEKK